MRSNIASISSYQGFKCRDAPPSINLKCLNLYKRALGFERKVRQTIKCATYREASSLKSLSTTLPRLFNTSFPKELHFIECCSPRKHQLVSTPLFERCRIECKYGRKDQQVL